MLKMFRNSCSLLSSLVWKHLFKCGGSLWGAKGRRSKRVCVSISHATNRTERTLAIDLRTNERRNSASVGSESICGYRVQHKSEIYDEEGKDKESPLKPTLRNSTFSVCRPTWSYCRVKGRYEKRERSLRGRGDPTWKLSFERPPKAIPRFVV